MQETEEERKETDTDFSVGLQKVLQTRVFTSKTEKTKTHFVHLFMLMHPKIKKGR